MGKKKYQKRGNKGKNIGVFLSLFLFILFASFKSIIFKKAKITILRQIYHEYKSKILSNLVINKGINKMIKLAPKFFEKLIYKDNLTRKWLDKIVTLNMKLINVQQTKKKKWKHLRLFISPDRSYLPLSWKKICKCRKLSSQLWCQVEHHNERTLSNLTCLFPNFG